MDIKYDYFRVDTEVTRTDTEVTRTNMQCYITFFF